MLKFLYLFIYIIGLIFILSDFFSIPTFIFFTPLLIMSYYRLPFIRALWLSLISGLIIDLFSSYTRLGTYAMNYCLTTFILYRYKFYFFEDRYSTLPIMCSIFALISLFLQAGVFALMDSSFVLAWEWLRHDIFTTIFQTILYTFFGFIFPFWIINEIKKHLFLFKMAKK